MPMPAARVGDSSSHGGVIISGTPSVLINGIPAARTGDMHLCAIYDHGSTPILSGSPTVMAGGMPLARIGDSVGCSATIVSGCPTVLTA